MILLEIILIERDKVLLSIVKYYREGNKTGRKPKLNFYINAWQSIAGK